MADDAVFRLFDEYAARHARGERPNTREFLRRAGEGEEELRELIDRFLAAVPPTAADEDEVAAFQAWLRGEPPLVELRSRRGVKREQLVDAIVERFRLAPAKREKVKRYVHELESGLLDPRGVDARVLETWTETLRARVSEFVTLRPRAPRAEPAYYRVSEAAVLRHVPAPAAEERDEVDALFIGVR
ncbi:MAG: hypothetical protein ACRDOP_09695 [Gaiellaceae bacterium]